MANMVYCQGQVRHFMKMLQKILTMNVSHQFKVVGLLELPVCEEKKTWKHLTVSSCSLCCCIRRGISCRNGVPIICVSITFHEQFKVTICCSKGVSDRSGQEEHWDSEHFQTVMRVTIFFSVRRRTVGLRLEYLFTVRWGKPSKIVSLL